MKIHLDSLSDLVYTVIRYDVTVKYRLEEI